MLEPVAMPHRNRPLVSTSPLRAGSAMTTVDGQTLAVLMRC
jgi:hypothetical protein